MIGSDGHNYDDMMI